MAFICPDCGDGLLEITWSIELPADHTWDENTFQLAHCQHCNLLAAAVYQESRRGSLVDEAWQHAGAVIDLTAYQQLENWLQACPAPGDRKCMCTTHQLLDVEQIFAGARRRFLLVRK